jgi:hypothetical protein
MKIIFFLPAGVIEWPVPETVATTFNFGAFVGSIRSAGYFQAENLYLRHEAMIGMSFAADDVAAAPVPNRSVMN